MVTYQFTFPFYPHSFVIRTKWAGCKRIRFSPDPSTIWTNPLNPQTHGILTLWLIVKDSLRLNIMLVSIALILLFISISSVFSPVVSLFLLPPASPTFHALFAAATWWTDAHVPIILQRTTHLLTYGCPTVINTGKMGVVIPAYISLIYFCALFSVLVYTHSLVARLTDFYKHGINPDFIRSTS